MKTKAHVIGQPPTPKNRLQEWASRNGIETVTQFCDVMTQNGIMSHGAAFDKWHSGRAGNTQYNTLLSIVRFLGAKKIEDVFDP